MHQVDVALLGFGNVGRAFADYIGRMRDQRIGLRIRAVADRSGGLLVEDDAALASVLTDNLAFEGFEIRSVADGRLVLGAIREFAPDLVILDWDLAILSGEEFIRLTRTPTTSPAPQVPLILMLSKPRRYAVDRAVALGVNEIIAKPFSPKVLWSRLDEVINRPRPFVQVKGLLRPVARTGAGPEKAAA
jgi:DNA-binding response OmpR family regulator